MLLRHPHDRTLVAAYGHDDVRGFWADVTCGGAVVSYDANGEDYDVGAPLRGGLAFMKGFGFFDGAEVFDILTYLGEKQVPRELRHAVRVARSWCEAAGL